MKHQRILSTLAVTGGLLAATLLTASPASAYAGADLEVAIGPNGTSSTGVVTITQGVANGDGTRAVVFSCEGLSTGDTASTAVRSCSLAVNGVVVQRAQAIALPGPAAATGGASLSVPRGASVSVCASVYSTFIVSPPMSVSKCSSTFVTAVV